jgi:hypothetical protein
MKTRTFNSILIFLVLFISSSLLGQGNISGRVVEQISNDDPRLSTEFENVSSASLDYCMPNPVVSSCAVRYSVPNGTTFAQLILQDAYGNVVFASEALIEGEGIYRLPTENLPNGNYYYTLTADFARVQTHTMVITH